MIELFSLTQLFALIFGLYFLAAGIGLLVDRNEFENFIEEMLQSTPIAYAIAILVFALGAITVAIHNIWTSILASFVSLIGWAMLFEGFLMLAFRRPFLRVVRKIPFTSTTAVPFGIGTILLGVVLISAALI